MKQRIAPTKGVGYERAATGTIEREVAADGRRLARFIASDETVDRYGDIIRASGWQLDNFRKNPVLLYAHQSRELPLGRVEPIAVEGTRLVAHTAWAKEGTSPFADMTWAMLEQNILSAVSVGFMPLADPTPLFDKDKQLTGFEFTAQDLLELSLVPVPANPNALQLAKQFPITDEERKRIFAAVTNDDVAAQVAAQTRAATITDLRYRRPIV